MKKLTIFLILLLCASFTQMSAQFQVRYEVDALCSLRILVNGSLTDGIYIPASTEPNATGLRTGTITVPEYATIEVFGIGRDYVVPVFTDDDPYVIESQKTLVPEDYYWPTNLNNTYSNSIDVPCDFFVGMYVTYNTI